MLSNARLSMKQMNDTGENNLLFNILLMSLNINNQLKVFDIITAGYELFETSLIKFPMYMKIIAPSRGSD